METSRFSYQDKRFVVSPMSEIKLSVVIYKFLSYGTTFWVVKKFIEQFERFVVQWDVYQVIGITAVVTRLFDVHELAT